jgi:hypothetical protein
MTVDGFWTRVFRQLLSQPRAIVAILFLSPLVGAVSIGPIIWSHDPSLQNPMRALQTIGTGRQVARILTEPAQAADSVKTFVATSASTVEVLLQWPAFAEAASINI